MAKTAWQTSVQCLQRGDFLCIFPEGTRTRTGQLQDFKLGYLRLAAETGAPVLPVRLANSYDVWPPHRRFPRLRRVGIEFHKPVQVAPDLSPSELRNLNAFIRSTCYQAC